MNRPLHFLLCAALALSLPAGLPAAEPAAGNAEAQLRDALKTSMRQLATTQADLATLQAAQPLLAEEKKLLAAQIELLKKHTGEDKVAADKAVAALNAKVSEQATELAQLKDDLAKTKANGDAAAALAATKEAERARLAAALIEAQRLVADRETKNLALFKVANEILARYEKFGLGEALAAKEPFVGTTRTKLENLVQGYQDKILDQRAKP